MRGWRSASTSQTGDIETCAARGRFGASLQNKTAKTQVKFTKNQDDTKYLNDTLVDDGSRHLQCYEDDVPRRNFAPDPIQRDYRERC